MSAGNLTRRLSELERTTAVLQPPKIEYVQLIGLEPVFDDRGRLINRRVTCKAVFDWRRTGAPNPKRPA
jgi:hypothetical protein